MERDLSDAESNSVDALLYPLYPDCVSYRMSRSLFISCSLSGLRAYQICLLCVFVSMGQGLESASIDFLVDTISRLSGMESLLVTEAPGLGGTYDNRCAGDHVTVLWLPDFIRYAGGDHMIIDKQECSGI